QVVCKEGDESDAMYVVLVGQIRVFKTDEEGNEVDIAALQSGEFFGEMAMFDNQPRSATVDCVTACHLFMLDKGAFMNLLQNARNRAISFSVLSALVKRVRAIMEKYFDEDLAQRILQAEMEAERHRPLAQLVAGVARPCIPH
ncbi:MAG: cyclic nucleotide-binding domain-containing protein, partial [Planctomycetaceae bacterium]|nr:cyclic nucleotide-binding domain-containing protein [Planctomycetaceae bacterium]